MKLSPAEKKLVLEKRAQDKKALEDAARQSRIKALRKELRELEGPRARPEPQCTCDQQWSDPNCPVIKAGGSWGSAGAACKLPRGY